jgi:O-methyltransferase involved in polyketide biosynthesis
LVRQRAAKPGGRREGCAASGTPFISFFTPSEILELAVAAGFESVRHVSAADLTDRYFSNRSDGLRPSSAEELLVAT